MVVAGRGGEEGEGEGGAEKGTTEQRHPSHAIAYNYTSPHRFYRLACTHTRSTRSLKECLIRLPPPPPPFLPSYSLFLFEPSHTISAARRHPLRIRSPSQSRTVLFLSYPIHPSPSSRLVCPRSPTHLPPVFPSLFLFAVSLPPSPLSFPLLFARTFYQSVPLSL